jgi:hypothetical protein
MRGEECSYWEKGRTHHKAREIYASDLKSSTKNIYMIQGISHSST